MSGKHIETVSLPGYWMCRPVIKGDNLYFAIINTYNWWNYDGMIAVLDKKNKVVSLRVEENHHTVKVLLINPFMMIAVSSIHMMFA